MRNDSEAPRRREPPAGVRRALRQKVGFGCPVCGSPFLSWHHFDPPWNVRRHHEPAGMVALCRDCHPQADRGAFTPDQLRQFKAAGRDRAAPLQGRFNWMRQQLLSVVGGTFYFETPVPVQFGARPVIWFNRDQGGHFLLNINMPSPPRSSRLRMEDNFWVTEGGDEVDLECPPGGHLIDARYPDGDQLTVRFRENDSPEELDARYPRDDMPVSELLCDSGGHFPITTVEITLRLRQFGIDFGPKRTEIRTNTFTGGWLSHCRVGMQIGTPGPVNPLGAFIRRVQGQRLGLPVG